MVICGSYMLHVDCVGNVNRQEAFCSWLSVVVVNVLHVNGVVNVKRQEALCSWLSVVVCSTLIVLCNVCTSEEL
jgi:hypothetical protein